MPENYNDMVAALTSRRQHFAGDDVLQRLRELREAREREEREPVFRDDPEPVSQFMPPPETEQALYDANVTPGYGMNLLQGASIAGSAVPVVGDLLGLAGDIQMYKEDPESRKWMNYLLTAAGALPIVPSLAYLMNRGGNAAPNAMRSPGNNQAGAIGYQGSPHRFDALDPAKIGTGDGSQLFGHGLYVAENPGVAGQYAQKLADRPQVLVGGEGMGPVTADDIIQAGRTGSMANDADKTVVARLSDRADAFGSMGHGMDPARVTNEVAEEIQRGIETAVSSGDEVVFLALSEQKLALQRMREQGIDFESQSYLYEIDVPDEDIAKMLDWDAPLSEQSEAVRDVAKQFGIKTTPSGMKEARGSDVYSAISQAKQKPPFDNTSMNPGSAEGSAYLSELGIPGIKYFDQGSRAAGEGTRNMVLFNALARRAKILKRNDETIAQPSVDEFIGKLLED